MIFTIQIDTSTKSGRKAYEFIECLKNKDGITYLDEPEYLTDEEVDEFEEEMINFLEERKNVLSQENEENSSNKTRKNFFTRNGCVAGSNSRY